MVDSRCPVERRAQPNSRRIYDRRIIEKSALHAEAWQRACVSVRSSARNRAMGGPCRRGSYIEHVERAAADERILAGTTRNATNPSPPLARSECRGTFEHRPAFARTSLGEHRAQRSANDATDVIPYYRVHGARTSGGRMMVGGGAIALGGVVTGLVFNAKANRAEERMHALQGSTGLYGCFEGGASPRATCDELLDEAKRKDTSRNTSTAAFLIGGGVAVGSAIYWLWPRRKPLPT